MMTISSLFPLRTFLQFNGLVKFGTFSSSSRTQHESVFSCFVSLFFFHHVPSSKVSQIGHMMGFHMELHSFCGNLFVTVCMTPKVSPAKSKQLEFEEFEIFHNKNEKNERRHDEGRHYSMK